MVDLVIRNALVVTCDEAGTVIADGGVAADGGRITQVATSTELAPLAERAKRVKELEAELERG